MLVVMRPEAQEPEVDRLCAEIRALGLTPHRLPGASRVAIGVTGQRGALDEQRLAELPGVVQLIATTRPYRLTSRQMHPADTIVRLGEVAVGGTEVVVIAGPCSVESYDQTLAAARRVRELGASMLRGGAFKPRTSPYTFQGLGPEALAILKAAREETGLPVVSECVDTESFDLVEELVDIVQIGSRNMQNYSLLKRAGRSTKPILLKRSMSGTCDELLMAAEYVLTEGNPRVMLCERGIRAFSDYSRYTLDISIVPELKRATHLPVLVDPSHAAGRRELVAPLARAAVAAGADGVLVEVHHAPDEALSDGPQALTVPMFREMMDELGRVARAVGRELRPSR